MVKYMYFIYEVFNDIFLHLATVLYRWKNFHLEFQFLPSFPLIIIENLSAKQVALSFRTDKNLLK